MPGCFCLGVFWQGNELLADSDFFFHALSSLLLAISSKAGHQLSPQSFLLHWPSCLQLSLHWVCDKDLHPDTVIDKEQCTSILSLGWKYASLANLSWDTREEAACWASLGSLTTQGGWSDTQPLKMIHYRGLFQKFHLLCPQMCECFSLVIVYSINRSP